MRAREPHEESDCKVGWGTIGGLEQRRCDLISLVNAPPGAAWRADRGAGVLEKALEDGCGLGPGAEMRTKVSWFGELTVQHRPH